MGIHSTHYGYFSISSQFAWIQFSKCSRCRRSLPLDGFPEIARLLPSVLYPSPYFFFSNASLSSTTSDSQTGQDLGFRGDGKSRPNQTGPKKLLCYVEPKIVTDEINPVRQHASSSISDDSTEFLQCIIHSDRLMSVVGLSHTRNEK